MVTPLRRLLSDDRYLDRLSERQLEEFAPPLKWSKYIPFRPTFRQRAFLMYDGMEALFGGAAGPGKSTALLMASLQYADTPGHAALIVRRTFADLEKPGALIPKSHEWLRGTDAHWTGRRWKFPSGAVLDFGYLDTEADIYKYQSTEYSTICWDELTQMPKESWYRYLFSRARRPVGSQVPIRILSASNPGGVGHEWVHRRFIAPQGHGDSVFIPAQLEDNPHLDRAEYEQMLALLPPVTYRQLRWGDWNVRPPGVFFQPEWFEIVPAAPANIRWIRTWDFAATKNQDSAYTAGARLGLVDGILYIGDMRRMRGDPGEVERLVRQTAELDGRGVEIWPEQEPGSGGVNTIFRYQRTVLTGYSVRPYLPKHDKLTRATPLSGAARAGNVKLVAGPWIQTFLDEVASFPDGYRDQVDATSAGLIILTQNPTPRIRGL